MLRRAVTIFDPLASAPSAAPSTSAWETCAASLSRRDALRVVTHLAGEDGDIEVTSSIINAVFLRLLK